MVNTLFGTKMGMTSSYDSRGRRVGATQVKISSNIVTQIKGDKDGYSAVVLGTQEKKSVRKPQLDQLKKIGVDKRMRFLREAKGDSSDLAPGQEIKLAQVFHIGDAVKVSGVSKGRGFQGGVRRYGFHGGPKTHGQSDRHRAPGSIGSGTTPGRIFKGKHMAGHYGNSSASYRGLEVVGINREEGIITIKGGIPGPVGGLIRVENIGRIKGYTPPPEEKEEEGEEAEEKAEGGNSQPTESVTANEGGGSSVQESGTQDPKHNDNAEGGENANQ